MSTLVLRWPARRVVWLYDTEERTWKERRLRKLKKQQTPGKKKGRRRR